MQDNGHICTTMQDNGHKKSSTLEWYTEIAVFLRDHGHYGAVVSGERRRAFVQSSGVVQNTRVEHWLRGTQSLCKPSN